MTGAHHDQAAAPAPPVPTAPTPRGRRNCPRRGCPRTISPYTFSCAPDWRQLPGNIRQALGDAWRAAGRGPQPIDSPQYEAAAAKALKHWENHCA